MPFEIIAWEKLFWFLKFLIPKLKIKDKDAESIDALLESVDLTSYGLERVKLSHSIGLDDAESELKPANPNPRGTHGGDQERDPLDEIIQSFNERWFQGWEATPEEQRVKFLSIMQNIQDHLSGVNYLVRLLLSPVAFPLKFDNGGVVYQSVYGGYGHHAVWEDLIPLAKGLVGCDDQAATLIAVGNELEQHLGFCIRLFHIAYVVDDDDSVFIQSCHGGHQVEVAFGLL